MGILNTIKYFVNHMKTIFELHVVRKALYISFISSLLFSSPGRSPGRAIVLPPASALAAAALAKSLTLKFFM